MVHLVILESILALEALFALLTLIDLIVVHYLMLLQSNKSGKDLMTDVALLRRTGNVFALVILESILTFELLFTQITRVEWLNG